MDELVQLEEELGISNTEEIIELDESGDEAGIFRIDHHFLTLIFIFHFLQKNQKDKGKSLTK